MTILNREIAAAMNELADVLDVQGDNPFRVRAYRRAARKIKYLQEELSELVARDYDLKQIHGIGKVIAAQIYEIIRTKNMRLLQREVAHLPKQINELLQIRGLGPKRIKMLKEMGIYTKKELENAIKSDALRELFSDKIISNIKKELTHPSQSNLHFRLFHLLPIIENILFHLKLLNGVVDVEATGEYRRKTEIVTSIDIIVACKTQQSIINTFLKFPQIRDIFIVEPMYALVRLNIGIFLSVRLVTQKQFGAALLFYTGSETHYQLLQEIALNKKFELTKDGLFQNKYRCSAAAEKEIYQQLRLDFIPPELRENRGELQAAQKHKLPNLITLNHIRGDLHCHTNATDGYNSIAAMVNAAKDIGYEYIAITDHSKHLTITHGLTEKQLLQQIKQIDKLNEKMSGIRILKGTEMDILEDGSLDFPNSVLKELDFTVCSIHSQFKLPQEKQTERIIRAMDNPYFNILAHPTGRLIRSRQPYPVDMKKIMKAAIERGCFLELNAQPFRLDIHDEYCLLAKKSGLKVAISSDAHSIRELEFMIYGIYQGRRGWLEADDVINTRDLKSLLKLFKRI